MDQNSSLSSTAQASTPPKSPVPLPKRDSRITWGITILSSVSLGLTLLGYGVSLAVEATFGIPHETVYSSVLDLVGLSKYAILALVLGLGDIPWQLLFEQVWPTSLLAGALLLVMTLVLAYIRARNVKGRKLTAAFCRYFRPPTKQDSTVMFIAKGAVASGLFSSFVMLTPLLIVGAMMVAVVLMSVLPMYGMQLGANYFEKFVVAPVECEPVRPRAILLQKRSEPRKRKAATTATATATCVELFKDDARLASGRVIVSTSSAIALFEPSGSARRVPISDLTVVRVGSDDTKAQSQRNADEPANK